MDPKKPFIPDRRNLIYLTMGLQGIGTLVAWNMFITAKSYFVEFKLKGTSYQNSFLVYVGYASQLPNVFFSWFNFFFNVGGNLTRRILISLSIEMGIFVVTIILAMTDTTNWAGGFFWISMISIFILNACNAVYQNSIFGMVARLPPKYTGAIILGNNVCGTVVVLLNWLTSLSGGSLKTSAIYYFIGGMAVLMACFDAYISLPLNKFYRYCEWVHRRTTTPTNTNQSQKVDYLQLLKQCWIQLINVFLVFFVSLGVFPAIHSDIYSMDNPTREYGKGFLGKNFALVTCFFTFNFTSMIGNITANRWHIPSRKYLIVFTALRLLFIPLFVYCNYHPKGVERTSSVLIKSDAVYWIFACLLGWSSGHGSSLGMMYACSGVTAEYAQKAGMLAGAILVTGILVGVAFSGLGPLFV